MEKSPSFCASCSTCLACFTQMKREVVFSCCGTLCSCCFCQFSTNERCSCTAFWPVFFLKTRNPISSFLHPIKLATNLFPLFRGEITKRMFLHLRQIPSLIFSFLHVREQIFARILRKHILASYISMHFLYFKVKTMPFNCRSGIGNIGPVWHSSASPLKSFFFRKTVLKKLFDKVASPIASCIDERKKQRESQDKLLFSSFISTHIFVREEEKQFYP